MCLRQKFVTLLHRCFDWRLGLWAIPIIGGMVAAVNISHGLFLALRAGLVAGLTAMVTTGSLCRLIKYSALIERRMVSYAVGTGVPTGVNLAIHLFGQWKNHTPELFWSVVAPTLLTFSSSMCLNFGTHYFQQHSFPPGWLGKLCHHVFGIPGTN